MLGRSAANQHVPSNPFDGHFVSIPESRFPAVKFLEGLDESLALVFQSGSFKQRWCGGLPFYFRGPSGDNLALVDDRNLVVSEGNVQIEAPCRLNNRRNHCVVNVVADASWMRSPIWCFLCESFLGIGL